MQLFRVYVGRSLAWRRTKKRSGNKLEHFRWFVSIPPLQKYPETDTFSAQQIGGKDYKRFLIVLFFQDNPSITETGSVSMMPLPSYNTPSLTETGSAGLENPTNINKAWVSYV